MGTCFRKIFAVLLLLATLGCKEQILHDLDELRANQVQLLLLRSSMNVEKVRSGKLWSIAVSPEEIPQALQLIERSRILKRDLERGAEQQAGLLQSSDERLRLLEHQLASRTEQTLEQIPGVLEARVHLHKDPDVDRSFSPSQKRNSASVLLLLSKGNGVSIPEVRALVAGAAGFQPEEVSILASDAAEDSEERDSIVPAIIQNHGPQQPGWQRYPWIAGACVASAVMGLWLLINVWSRGRRMSRLVDLGDRAEESIEIEAESERLRFRNPFGSAAMSSAPEPRVEP